jgi:hypothetical protein
MSVKGKSSRDELMCQEAPIIYSKENESINNENDGFCSWIVGKNNTFFPTEKIIIIPKLIPGKYKIIYDNQRSSYAFIKETINSDELLDLPSPIFKSILNDIDYFWEHKELFEKYNYVHKRGIFLHGTAGCGKSSICARLSNQAIEKGGIVLYVSDPGSLELYNSCIPNIFRLIEPNTKILTIFEDLDGLVKHGDYETMLLNILDGNNQLNNVVYVGCSNYPEMLKDRILNRPSRFDRRYLIDKPNAEMREYYFRHKICSDDYDDEIIKNIVTKTEGLTLAHLGEFVKSVYIFKMDVDETISLLKGMSEFISSKSNIESNKKLGFNKQ